MRFLCSFNSFSRISFSFLMRRARLSDSTELIGLCFSMIYMFFKSSLVLSYLGSAGGVIFFSGDSSSYFKSM